ncbi:MAG: hypothetical protein M1821_004946 [Bathelium mastoideum]|nr:MAG: hypothetical protein M1821_004946 [Bathelium mastoideum]KAI9689010.1 MAG: hypothetical protein M1822_000747 [Bathelium mastoideum]
MTTLKRKNEAVTEGGAPYNKRARPISDDEDNGKEDAVQKQSVYRGGATTSRANFETGQRQAFPGLDDADDGEELFYGPASDGIEYLRMVRTEARGVPHVLGSIEVASSESDDHRAWYFDGAYVARPILGPQLPSSFRKAENADPERHRRNTSSELSDDDSCDGVDDSDDTEPDVMTSIGRIAQSAYHGRLLTRFRNQTDDLQQTPPEDFVTKAIGLDFPSDFDESHASSHKTRCILRFETPSPVQVALMDPEMVLRVIQVISDQVMKPGKLISSPTSVWIWSLLARLAGFIGTLSTEDVSIVRDLAKCARNWTDGGAIHENRGQKHDLDDGELEAYAEEDGDEDAALDDEGREELALNTRVTLDMMITVVGEIYGQRDLLDSREVW